ncbi:MAG: hypothetical protein EZS28_056296, partial [Streblomastix strix]
YPIAIINKDPEAYSFVDIDGCQKKITIKKEKNNTISLSQVLSNGAWSLEAKFQNANGWPAIGVVQDSYDVPEGAGYWLEPPYCCIRRTV